MPIRCLVLALSAMILNSGCGRGIGDGRALAAQNSARKSPAAASEKAAPQPQAGDAPHDTLPASRNKQTEEAMPRHPFPGAKRAPSLDGGLGWINTAGPLDIKDLRGKFVLLDFWTYCCINCMHILPELKKLEQAYPNELVVIGVHSAKFETEQDSKNITDAVLRYEIEHPVVNDAHHVIWDRYSISSWPSLRVIDPEGNLVAGDNGEVQFEVLDRFLKAAIPYYRKKGLLDETPLRFDLEAYASDKTPLRFPGKVLADEQGQRLFIADSNHNRIVIASLDGTLQEVIGSGEIGAADGNYAKASFNKPQGMALTDEMLYLADTENHLIRKIDLTKKQVATIAGRGFQGRNAWPGLNLEEVNSGRDAKLPSRWVGSPLKTAINSPWALWIHGDELFIAMAGPHQIWKMPLDESEIGPYAGNGREDIVDGPLLPKRPYEEGFASFAQPSGLTSDGTWLYVADSEGSSIRAVPFERSKHPEVWTVVGTSHLRSARLFTFGDVDGAGEKVRLQHALGVAYHNKLIYVADTYNNKLKVVDPKRGFSRTLAGNGKPGRSDNPPQFDEPAGLSFAGGKLYVADTNNHLIRVVDLDHGNKVSTLTIKGLEPPTLAPPKSDGALPGARQIELPAQSVQADQGKMRLAVRLELPEGYKINDRAPMSYRVEALADSGVVERSSFGAAKKVQKPATEFEIALPLSADRGQDTLKITLTYYYCQEKSEGLCKVGSVVWTAPIEVSPDAQRKQGLLGLKVE
jgi:thiol-disulfide isomerase/thioredoxin